MERFLYPARVGSFPIMVTMIKIPFSICTLTWRVKNSVSRQGKGTNRLKKTVIII